LGSKKKMNKRKTSNDKYLSQNEIDELISLIGDSKDSNDEHIEQKRKIKIYDFQRPDILGVQTSRILSRIMEDYAEKLQVLFQNKYGLDVKVHLASLDQLTREEFLRCIPTPSFNCSASWLNGLVLFEMDPSSFLKGILKQNTKRAGNILPLEKNIFMHFIAEPCMEMLNQVFCANGEQLPAFGEMSFEGNPMFLPYSEYSCEMGALATIELDFGKHKDNWHLMSVFFNAAVLEELEEQKILWCGVKNRVVSLEKPEGNCIVEIGRCKISDVCQLEKNMVLELNTLVGNPLRVFVEGKLMYKGEAVVIDDSLGVRLCGKAGNEPCESEFYNTRVVLGTAYLSKEEIAGLGDGSILELDRYWNERIPVYKDGVQIADGEIVVLDESFAIKLKNICSV